MDAEAPIKNIRTTSKASGSRSNNERMGVYVSLSISVLLCFVFGEYVCGCDVRVYPCTNFI